MNFFKSVFLCLTILGIQNSIFSAMTIEADQNNKYPVAVLISEKNFVISVQIEFGNNADQQAFLKEAENDYILNKIICCFGLTTVSFFNLSKPISTLEISQAIRACIRRSGIKNIQLLIIN